MHCMERALELNHSLMHIDISGNMVDKEGCEAIARGLRKNDSVLGVHTIGNALFMDPNGKT